MGEFCSWLYWFLRFAPLPVASSHRPTVDFQLFLSFQIALLYFSLFTFLAIKLPSIYYRICFVIKSPTVRSTLWYLTVLVISVSPTIFSWFSYEATYVESNILRYFSSMVFLPQTHNKEVINFIIMFNTAICCFIFGGNLGWGGKIKGCHGRHTL